MLNVHLSARPEEIYSWACDLIRALKRKRSYDHAERFINDTLADKGEGPFLALKRD